MAYELNKDPSAFDISTDPSVLQRVVPSTKLGPTQQAVTATPPTVATDDPKAAAYKAQVDAAIANQNADQSGGGGAAATIPPNLSDPAQLKPPTIPDDPVQARLEAQMERDADAARATNAALQKRLAGDASMLPPEYKPLPMPDIQQTNPVQAWGSAAMVIAALGGLMTRNHATTAMKAASGVLDAFHKGDVEASDAAMERWKIANENMQSAAKFQIDRINADLALADKDEALGVAAFNADKAALGMHMDDARNKIDMQRLMVDMQTAYGQNADVQSRLLMQYQVQRAFIQKVNDPKFQGLPPDKKLEQIQPYLDAMNSKGGSGVSMPIEAAQGIATSMTQVGWGPLKAVPAYGSGGKIRDEILMAGQQQYGPGFTSIVQQADNANAGRRQAQVWLGRRAAQADTAAGEAAGMIPTLRAMSEAVPRGKFVPFNILHQMISRGLSDQDLIGFDTTINGFIRMYARAINVQGSPTVNDMEHARELLNVATSPEAFERQLDILNLEMTIAQQQGPTIAWESQVRFAQQYGLKPPPRPPDLDRMEALYRSGSLAAGAAPPNTTPAAPPSDDDGGQYGGFSEQPSKQ